MGLPDELLHTLARLELTTAFPIQSATIADALAGRDVLGKARTGSGKTLAFGLPMLARLAGSERPGPRRPLALILVPTRELAMQVGDALEPYTHAMGLSIRLIAGGLSMSKQIMSLERGVHVLVATPGRLSDLMRRGNADLSQVRITVLDEADHMAEMGFAEEITEILDKTSADAQRLLFSATLDGVVDTLVARFMTNPVMHDVTDGTDVPSQRHVVLSVPPHEKYRMATRIAAREGRTLCFVRTKLAADRVAADMRSQGVLAVALHGDRAQNERNLAMTEFRAGRLPVLVATDVAARGIHVDAVDLVLQIDPPADYRDYTHRAGRTGRAGADGLAVLLSLPHQRSAVQRILENANITAEDESFRTIDAMALQRIDQLTGAREPTGGWVDEPLPPARNERRGSRGRPDRQGGRGDRQGGRVERRPSRPSGRRDESSAGRDQLTARERELVERERSLAERERRLAQAEASQSAPSSASTSAGSDERRSAPPRKTFGRDDKRPSRDDKRPAYGDRRPARDEKRPARDDARPAWKDSRPPRDDRGGDRSGGAPRWADKGGRDDTRAPRDDSRGARGERPAYRGKTDSARGERPAYRGKTDSARGERPGYSRPPTGDRKAPGDGGPTHWSDKAENRRGSQPTRAERREREFAPREAEAKKRFGDDFDPNRTPRKPRAKKSKDGKGSRAGDAGSSRRGKARVKGPGKTAG
ncbi:MAG: RNA helicase, partial [Actinobacteria bacterium HGW-Actinobacteria-8]